MLLERQPEWLEEQGYMLRSRYRPEWIPSYTEDDDPYDFEDGGLLMHPSTLDATRIATNELVMLKRVLQQAFEGLYFMHLCHVAHRDCGRQNIMMDPKPLFPKMYHPRYTNYSRDFKGVAKYYNRTSMPVQYYLIDFGLSRRYDPENISPREEPIIGGDKSVPEFKNWTEAMDPFPTDVYYIGNVIRVDFLRIYRNLEFMKPLIHDMVQDDPSKRPTMEEVVNRFSETYHNLPKSILRSRLAGRRESNHPILFIQRHVRHYIRTVIHILLGRNPMPTPS
ncbi:hypothetical protein ABKN59_011684 [Abortiporus biennis]